jgi:hypothetical protein
MSLSDATRSQSKIFDRRARTYQALPCYIASTIILVIWISGCAAGDAAAIRPRANEVRTVVPITDDGKAVTLNNAMVYYDRPFLYEHGIRFPPGRYVLEAQDPSYWYLRAPTPMEFRDFEHGQHDERSTTSRSSVGGIVLAKSNLNLSIPAGGYVDGDSGRKIIVWILGGDFILREGKEWSKTF